MPCDVIYLHALAADFSVGVNNVVGSETHKKKNSLKTLTYCCLFGWNTCVHVLPNVVHTNTVYQFSAFTDNTSTEDIFLRTRNITFHYAEITNQQNLLITPTDNTGRSKYTRIHFPVIQKKKLLARIKI